MILESFSNILHFSHIENFDAVFHFDDFVWIDDSGNIAIYERLKIIIDLKENIMKDASTDFTKLTAEEVMILLWYHTIITGHVKIHVVANWSVLTNSPNQLIRRNSIITVMYNYFGNTLFPYILKYLYWTKCLAVDNSSAFIATFEHSLKAGIKYHGNLHLLENYSTTTKFILMFKPVFEILFDEYKDDFPIISRIY